jgi:hypothetical protein
VPESTARIVAENFINSRLNGVAQKGSTTNLINITSSINAKYTGLYVFKNASGTGFYIISSEYGNHPVLGYSDDTTISSPGQIAPGLLYFLDWYQSVNENLKGIPQSKGVNDELSSQIKREWEALLSAEGNKSSLGAKPTAAELLLEVDPLLTTKWKQSTPYNQNTPVVKDDEGKDKNAVTGCVATAMAQIMKYHNHPTTGTGSHTYTIPNDNYNWNGETLTANFEATTYDWVNMLDSYSSTTPNPTTAQKDAVATLMLHAGVSVNMRYGHSASSASSFDAALALKDYFRYPHAKYVSKSNDYNDTQWLNLIKEQITEDYPVYFSGRDSDDNGHAFVADGYDSSNLIHFNFGWGGYSDGYYQITQPLEYSEDQAVIINIYPPSCTVPSGLNASVNGTSATLKWNAVSDAKNYTLEYKTSSSSAWTTGSASLTSTSYTLSGLKAGTTYDWRVRADCSENASDTFYVLPAPTTPTNLKADVTGTSAVLSWTPVSGATSYTLLYRPSTTGLWTTVDVSAANYTATLSTNMYYFWQVRANNASGSSAYATGTYFYVLTAPSGLNAKVSSTSATLKWNAVFGADSYIVSYKLSSASSWTSQTVTTNSLVETLSYGIYNWKVQAVYTTTDITGKSAEIMGTNFSVDPYCISQSSNTDDRINTVVFGNINNTSTGIGGYENFTSIYTDVTKGASYPITITPYWKSTIYPEGYAVFIDFNQNGDFSDAGETVWTQTPIKANPVSGTITIPANALSGTTRMRVSMKYNGIPGPCESFAYGQVEDYTVNISGETLAIEDISNSSAASGITVYPNPVEDILHISGINFLSDEYTQVTIIDRNGRIVKVSQVKVEDSIKINVSDLSPNIYYLNILGRSFQIIKI